MPYYGSYKIDSQHLTSSCNSLSTYMEKHHICIPGSFPLEAGGQLEQLEITYHTAGVLHSTSKVVWICHALTANSNPEEWWPGMVGPCRFYNPDEYFIICANLLGSCYGSSGPLSSNPATQVPYYLDFPLVTIRDMARAHDALRQHLDIERIHTVIGSSVGGFQALEMTLLFPDRIQHLVLLATNSRVTPWATALNEAQRMAILADRSYFEHRTEAGAEGLRAARAMALISYRSYEGYNQTQGEADVDTLFAQRASSYEQYQGKKLSDRFNAHSYVVLTKAIDSHNVGRGRGGVATALETITAKTLLIGIKGDLLFPLQEQQFIQAHIPQSHYMEIQSDFGHDGFLLESNQIAEAIQQFYDSKK